MSTSCPSDIIHAIVFQIQASPYSSPLLLLYCEPKTEEPMNGGGLGTRLGLMLLLKVHYYSATILYIETKWQLHTNISTP